MKVLLLSAYDADSHRYWRKGLVENFPQFQFTPLTLPARYFSWRVRGNSLSWAFQERETLEADYQLIIATSMTDLSALRGFVPHLATIPTVLYFHENQFAYPQTTQARRDVAPQILSLYSALCANTLAFNSDYNRSTFLAGVRQLLKQLPDHVPAGLEEELYARSCLLPVPLRQLDTSLNDPAHASFSRTRWRATEEGGAWRILWAARWEYDKGPNLLLEIVRCLEAQAIDYRLCILGQRFRQVPAAFDEIRVITGERLVQFGYETSVVDYQQWLQSADLVLSTAEHEFQGVALQEAVTAGCIPVAPKRLVYPELLPTECLYEVQGLSEDAQAAQAVKCMTQLMTPKYKPSINTSDWTWPALKSRYHESFVQTLQRKASGI